MGAMIQRRALLFVALLSLTFEGFAQVSVRGRVLGLEDKKAIAAAIVSLTPLSGGAIRQTISIIGKTKR